MIIDGKENLDQVKQIYNSSTKEFISEESNDSAIADEHMVSYLYYEDENPNIALGYITMYEAPDFVEKEEFDVVVDNISADSVYIWEVGTRKGYEGRGIASKLLKFVTEYYAGRDIYTCLDEENKASIRIHEKAGFVKVAEFIGHFFSDEDEHYFIAKWSSKQ